MIHRTDKRKDKYAAVSQAMLRNTGLSLKAKGLLSLMLSMADGWEFSVDGLEQLTKDGRDSISAAVKELENAGYIVKQRKRENGKFVGWIYDIYESPKTDSPKSEKPKTDSPKSEKPQQRIINNNKNNQVKNNQYAGGAKKPKVLNGGRTEPSYDIGAFEAEVLRPVLYRKKG